LLARFYDPQAGQIFIDGIDIKKVPPKDLRGEIGFVFQETFLFSDTVANNIRYAKPDADIGEVEAAARIAQAHEFIMQVPQGYDAPIGEGGLKLSGGQRQRLAIARALANEPTLVLADEPTGALDSEGGEEVLELFRRLHAGGQTILLVTHDQPVADAAQRLVRMKDGRVVDHGGRDPELDDGETQPIAASA